jgi:hypothetical protein
MRTPLDFARVRSLSSLSSLSVILAALALGVACGGGGAGKGASAAPAPSASASASAANDGEASAPTEDDQDGACTGKECLAKCDAKGRAGDCLAAGEALRNGSDGVAEDHKRAAKYLDKACTLGEREGCYRLADLFFTGDGVDADVAKGVALLGKACDLGRGDACDQLAKRAEKGEGVPKDHRRAVALLAKGCVAEDYQVWTCSSLREAAEKKDPEAVKALADWKKGCDATKEAKACAGVERTTKPKKP